MYGLSLYHWHEMQHAAAQPWRALAQTVHALTSLPINPMARTDLSRSISGWCEMFERTTRFYTKPAWRISSGYDQAPIEPIVVWERPFCKLVHFDRVYNEQDASRPTILLVAPLSGHYATLLRGTVEALLPDHDVYVTDWADARMVPLSMGRFDLDDYIEYIIAMLSYLGGKTHVIAVCQPTVPVLAAVALMEANKHPFVPASMTLIGGPIDTRINPTTVNELAQSKGLDWFRRHVIFDVPSSYPGAMRAVYPGFLQRGSFMAMNLERHIGSHADMLTHLVRGDEESARRHRLFYDEYMAVMDIPAEFYLQTVDTVFIRQDLPRGEMTHGSQFIAPERIRAVSLLTIEGGRDDITGLGQTAAAHRLCSGIPDARKIHYTQPDVGHYGLFSGSLFRAKIAPLIAQFIKTVQSDRVSWHPALSVGRAHAG